MLGNLSVRAKTGIIASIIAALVFILVAAANGIIGNRADAFVLWLWDLVRGPIQASLSLWSIVFPPWILLVCVTTIWFRDRSNLSRVIRSLGHAIEHVNNLDNSLVRCAPQLLSSKKPGCDLECEARSIVRLLLKQATEAFPKDVHRAFLLLPDPFPNGKYLKVWEDYGGIDKDSRGRKIFYIGKEEQPGLKRGIAGEAFHKRSLIIAHIIEQNDAWEPDRESYICFEPEKKTSSVCPAPPYSSLVCVPLVVQKGDGECLGVVCFDSKNQKVFDSSEVASLLFLLAARVRAIMVIYQDVQAFFSKGSTQAGE